MAVPSIARTCVSATAGSATRTNFRASGERVVASCAEQNKGATIAIIEAAYNNPPHIGCFPLRSLEFLHWDSSANVIYLGLLLWMLLSDQRA